MSKKEKLLKRLKSRPKDFSYDELITLLGFLGYNEDSKGKTSGSRVRFSDGKTNILLHKPHQNGSILKIYQIDEIINHLIEENKI